MPYLLNVTNCKARFDVKHFHFFKLESFLRQKKNIVLCFNLTAALQKSNLAGTSNDTRWGNREEKAGWWKCGSRSGGWWMMRWDWMGGGVGGSCRCQPDKGVLIIFGKHTRSYWFGALANELQFVKRCLIPQRCRTVYYLSPLRNL